MFNIPSFLYIIFLFSYFFSAVCIYLFVLNYPFLLFGAHSHHRLQCNPPYRGRKFKAHTKFILLSYVSSECYRFKHFLHLFCVGSGIALSCPRGRVAFVSQHQVAAYPYKILGEVSVPFHKRFGCSLQSPFWRALFSLLPVPDAVKHNYRIQAHHCGRPCLGAKHHLSLSWNVNFCILCARAADSVVPSAFAARNFMERSGIRLLLFPSFLPFLFHSLSQLPNTTPTIVPFAISRKFVYLETKVFLSKEYPRRKLSN